ncbi:MAG TPA: Gfo/Idh/MocA family oxidoreductase [Chloroflexota bacterium]|jgi:predicted dehydrogenase|nr:Gfo/Idh/MocA family oxidoreductase [Chloroflexota bacterium]
MAESVGVGIIGTGTIAQAHLESLRGAPRGRAVAVFDVLGDRAEQTAQQFGIPYVAKSVEDLLARPDVDAVIVCTPPFAHAEPTIKALEAGKHVLCEKPFALDPTDAERMVRAAERAGRFLACASGRGRYSPAQRKAREMMETGELGDVYHVRSTSLRFRGRPGHHIFPQSAWFLDSQRAGGGVIMDGAVYTVDSVLWLLGNPKVLSVTAAMRQFTEEPPAGGVKQDVEDHAVIMLQCEGGKSAVIESAWVSNMDEADGLFVFGTRAGLRFNPLRKITAQRVDPGEIEAAPGFLGEDIFRPVQERVFPFEWGGGGMGALGDIAARFVDGIVEGKQPMTPGLDALEVTRVIDAAYRSVRDQRAVALA